MMAVFIVLVVAAVVLVVRATSGPQQTTTSFTPGTPRDTPRESEAQRVLDERFARGDIDEREYVARRDFSADARDPLPARRVEGYPPRSRQQTPRGGAFGRTRHTGRADLCTTGSGTPGRW